MTIDISQFYQVFFEESAEHLAEMERLLLALDIDAPDIEEMNAIFRAAHSIKGGSGTFGFRDMAEVTHVLENLLDRLRKGEMAPTAEMIDAFLEATDVIKEQLSNHVAGTEYPPETAQAICDKLQLLTRDDASAEPDHEALPGTQEDDSLLDTAPVVTRQEQAYEIVFTPPKSFIKRENAMQSLMEELAAAGSLSVIEEGIAGKKKNMKKARPWRFFLVTSSPRETLDDIFSLVADAENVTITASADPQDESYGFFDSTPIATPPPVFSSDGFFTPSSPGEQDDGFGFFEPLQPIVEEADQGYGFFEEHPAPAVTEEGDGFGFFEPLPAQPPSPPAPKAAPAKPKEKVAATGETSIRVSVERVDQLINLVGELVITQAMLAEVAAGVDPVLQEKLLSGMAQLERNTRDLQESVMSIRMMPISFVFSRFPRVVRDLAAKLDKQVELMTFGENTELDKGLIEKIADPLTHLIRNSLDHGIERPETRVAAGKPAKGTITLSASHQGGNIVIEVTDDGAGLNRDKILAKATERGLPASASLSDNDVWMLIFEPGFSTAETVTDVSGRGVGMDVVKRNIAEMGGVIALSSAAGQGTTTTIRLPLTLAILDGMSVSLGDNVYVIPLNMIIETLQPQPEDIRTVAGQGHMVHVRGEYLPIIALHTVFNLPTAVTDPCHGVLILIEADGKKAALFVDALVGQQQVVIKSLETNFRKIVGISGATIMGDGTVALILDVAMLIKLGQ